MERSLKEWKEIRKKGLTTKQLIEELMEADPNGNKRVHFMAGWWDGPAIKTVDRTGKKIFLG